MNGHANCILAVCCPPYSEGHINSLANEIATGTGLAVADATAVAFWIIKNYDLAPPGSLQAFKDTVRDLAREGYVKAGT